MAKVFLSAGHGGKDPGAVAYGLKEKDINLNALLACNEVLKRHGVKTVLSRSKDEDDPVGQEVREANASGADLAVSFHANAGGGDGFEAFYHTSNAKGKKLSQIAEKYVKAMGQNSRGLRSGNHLYFIKHTTMTAVLFESFFLDNDKDNDIGDTVAEQKAFGVAYAKAILEYLGITYKDAGTTKPSTSKPSTQKPSASESSFKVKVEINNLNIRKGPGTNYDKIGKFTGVGVFTIVDVKDGKGSKTGWGKLKSGAGWISLDFAKRI